MKTDEFHLLQNLDPVLTQFTPRRITILALWILVAAISPLNLFADGFHNSTKKFTAPSDMSESDWSDPEEIKRTWDAALVRIPNGERGVIRSSIDQLGDESVDVGKKFPTVIYLHGCSGVWKGTYERIDFLAQNGFAVIAPVSFARKKYAKSCDPASHQGGMYRPTLKMRQFDAENAIKQAKKLSWVDSENVFLMGLSQGGITTATFHSDNPEASVAARVVEGWTCHAGWKEYGGIGAPESEPVLTLVAENDPWFRNPPLKGDCGEFLNPNNGSKSIVYRTGRLRNQHELLASEKAQQAVLEFLREQTHD